MEMMAVIGIAAVVAGLTIEMKFGCAGCLCQ